jgi:hypothetical protein
MRLEDWYWLAIAACALHVLEEFFPDWRGWVKSSTGIDVSLSAFWTMNVLALALGATYAAVASLSPAVGLAIPAVMLINATVFHVGGWIWQRGRFSPGLITSLLLFYPISIGCYQSAYAAGLLTSSSLAYSFFLAAVATAAPMRVLRGFARK